MIQTMEILDQAKARFKYVLLFCSRSYIEFCDEKDIVDVFSNSEFALIRFKGIGGEAELEVKDQTTFTDCNYMDENTKFFSKDGKYGGKAESRHGGVKVGYTWYAKRIIDNWIK